MCIRDRPSVASNIFLSFRFLQSVLDLWCVSQIGEIKMDWPKWETEYKTTNYQQSIFQHQICWGNFFSLLLSFMAAMQREIIFKEFIFTSNKIFLIVMKILVEYWYKIALYFSSLQLWKWLNLRRKQSLSEGFINVWILYKKVCISSKRNLQ